MMEKQKVNTPLTVFVLSAATCAFWITVQFVDVYYFAVSGALFEILWFPMIGLLYGLPVVSFIFLIRDKFQFRSLHLYSFLITFITLLFMTLGN
jgi:hypothetical protein